MASEENAIVNACLDYLNSLDIVCWWNVTRHFKYRPKLGIKGVPDIIGILQDGRFIGVECKTKTGKQSPDQIDFQAICDSRNACYYIVTSVEELSKKFFGQRLSF